MARNLNPGELNERISILSINQAENTYTWEPTSESWAKIEQLTGNNLFSKVGLGAKSVKITARKKCGLTLHNAFLWKGKHCFLTDICEIDRAYYEITAALIEPQICTIERTNPPRLNELNRPIYDESTVISFPGCVTEKYMGHVQNEPMATKEIRNVLVTPKNITVKCGEIVTINNIAYNVLIAHELDEYKNEYEILVKEDI